MKNKLLYSLILPLALIMLWYIVSSFKLVSPLFISSPSKVLISVLNLTISGVLFLDIGFTLYRASAGFLLACLVGIPVGMLMGFSDRVYCSLEMAVEFFRSIPATALFPVFMLVFGIGDLSKIVIIAWSAGLILIINSMYGVHHAKELRVKAAKTMKASRNDIFWKILFPEALPQIFSGLRVAISISLIIVIVTEMFIGTNYGIGFKILNAQMVYNIPEMYAYIIIAGLLGYFINRVFIKIEEQLIHWKGK